MVHLLAVIGDQREAFCGIEVEDCPESDNPMDVLEEPGVKQRTTMWGLILKYYGASQVDAYSRRCRETCERNYVRRKGESSNVLA
ncbi:hypothetical protein PC116_g27475 [Phytophthora cactorum]|uniref:Uncharacterized protein n=1 Tax=Phytophthora cactorum TaxID=29920 RepID=A0A8T1BZ03_9STRA|nr:hypothetical protein PC117_g19709 [Phytophthora cactorum]KAG2963635.1 hypothetical protein PC119_g25454 [Phytophthora cactorum]KAG2978291.1 hypothetical protein PC120_g25348 [Phytophthora cactorum]KAG3137209.1 hypothetical protein PC128_g25782 [Phytophthora cactorum]KAG4058336.1 hypothetical protein PC123_g6673 [Phytophthora cactorum]